MTHFSLFSFRCPTWRKSARGGRGCGKNSAESRIFIPALCRGGSCETTAETRQKESVLNFPFPPFLFVSVYPSRRVNAFPKPPRSPFSSSVPPSILKSEMLPSSITFSKVSPLHGSCTLSLSLAIRGGGLSTGSGGESSSINAPYSLDLVKMSNALKTKHCFSRWNFETWLEIKLTH